MANEFFLHFSDLYISYMSSKVNYLVKIHMEEI